MASKPQDRRVRNEVALKLKAQEENVQRFKTLSLKIKNKEQLDKAELAQFHDLTRNSRIEKVLQTNEYVVDSMVREKFDDPMLYDVFVARCRDIGEPLTGTDA